MQRLKCLAGSQEDRLVNENKTEVGDLSKAEVASSSEEAIVEPETSAPVKGTS